MFDEQINKQHERNGRMSPIATELIKIPALWIQLVIETLFNCNQLKIVKIEKIPTQTNHQWNIYVVFLKKKPTVCLPGCLIHSIIFVTDNHKHIINQEQNKPHF